MAETAGSNPSGPEASWRNSVQEESATDLENLLGTGISAAQEQLPARLAALAADRVEVGLGDLVDLILRLTGADHSRRCRAQQIGDTMRAPVDDGDA